jgi:hypothetical protein
MIKSLFVILSLYIHGIQAAQYYPYETTPIKLSQASLNRYIVPNAKTIVKYYYSILVQIHDINKPLLKLKDYSRQLVTSLKKFEQSCPLMNKQCHERLKRIYRLSRNIDQTVLSIQKRDMSLIMNKNAEDFLEQNKIKKKSHSFYLKLMGIIDHIGNTNYKLMHYLEEYRLTANTRYSTYFRKKNVITNLSYEILTNTKMAMTTMLDKKIRPDFEAVWLQFIDLLEVNIIEGRDRKFLINRLEDLNMSWNTFHMKMTKGNYKIPKSMTKTIRSMHTYWNLILKVILR